MYNMLILYRSCDLEVSSPIRSDRTDWFDKKKSFLTLHNSIKKSKNNISIKILFDEAKGKELGKFIESLGYEVEYRNLGSNENSLLWQLDYAEKAIKNFDYLYLLEDDYIHREDAIDTIINGLEKLDLVTGYDHLDRYLREDDATKNKESIYFIKDKHWRTCESTTCTWAVSSKIARTVIKKAKIFLLKDRELFRELIKNKIRLHSPIPAVSTHIHKSFMSPGQNWQRISEKV